MNRKNLRNTKQKIEIYSEDFTRTSSALLIPEKYLLIFKELCKTRNRTQVLEYLLVKYKAFIILGQMQNSKKIKTLFQSKGQKLKRISFKPKNKDWIELGIIASGLGCSRTLIFSTFLEFELRGIAEFFQSSPVKEEVSYLMKFRANTVWRLLPKDQGFLRILWYLRI